MEDERRARGRENWRARMRGNGGWEEIEGSSEGEREGSGIVRGE